MAGCSTPTISEIERGTAGYSVSLLNRVAKALGVEPGWLLSRDPRDASDVWDLAEELRRLPPAERTRFAAVLRTLIAPETCDRQK